MKATIAGLAALLALAVFAPASPAQYYGRPYNPYYYPPIPRAPDICNPNCSYNPCAGMFGPNLNVYPPFQPFNGAVFPPSNGGGGATQLFPTHPFARSPRDYFMVN